jgi:GxxExxY protein
MENLLFKDEVFAIQKAIFEVNREMGAGFLEAVYQECLIREFTGLAIPFIAHSELALSYKGAPLAQAYKPDFICYGKIIVELKATQDLVALHRAQVLNYLKATRFRLGILVNFGAHPKAQIERIVN